MMNKSTEDNKILVFVERRTPRLSYIFNLIFRELLGLNLEITIDKSVFKNSIIPKLSYGYSDIGEDLFIAADSLLYERGITDIVLTFSTYNNLPCFFNTYNKKSAFPFDLFAASFYLVSRYEEYLPYINDKYGRFPASESIAFNKGFLQKPLVNIWSIDLGNKLKEIFHDLTITTPTYKYLPTIDIDAAFAYKDKGFWRIIGGYLKDLRDRKFDDINERTNVLLGKGKDPFDSFDYIFQLHKSFNLIPIFFILYADYGNNDKNLPTYNWKFQALIRHIADYGEIGIHPSFASNTEKIKLEKEIKLLSKITHSEITKSRQHFLIINMPETYRNISNHGIKNDYSMGFAANPGFRASICTPFYFYNLEHEMITSLKINPFAYMEGTLKDYMGLDTDAAYIIIKDLIDEVKAVGGTFISLWHNESLGGKKRWKGWPEIYERSLQYGRILP